MSFYAIYKNQENCNTIGDILLQGGPQKDLLFCNVVPGRGAAAVTVKFWRGLAGVRPGRVGERSTGHWGPVCVSLGARGGRWEGARRRSGAPATAAGNAGEGRGLRRWLGGRRVVVELEVGAGDLGVALGVAGRGGRVPGSVASAAWARGGRPAP
jgi:hypothetical protein